MEPTSVILGPVVTEKAEAQKAARKTYSLLVNPKATKIDVKNALRKLYGVSVSSVRVMRVRSKARSLGAGRVFTKRHAAKKMLVTLSEKSAPLDLVKFSS